MHKQIFFIAVLLFSLGINLFSEDWYISNAAGMALEKTFSAAALREAYALSIENREPNNIPAEIAEYLASSIALPEIYSAEHHTLYNNGEEKNQRWILRYEKGNPFIVISVNENGSSGFAEYYNDEGLMIREDSFFDDRIVFNLYRYNNELLAESETWQITRTVDVDNALDAENPDEEESGFIETETDDSELNLPETDNAAQADTDQAEESVEAETHLWSDVYRYTRIGSLRSVLRTFLPDTEKNDTRLTRFAPISPHSENVSAPSSAPTLSSDFLADIINLANKNVEYVRDEDGRIISEIYTDDEGQKIGELHIVWLGGRLASIGWNGENDKRRIEYEYDENGNRTIERNYRGGVLERLVRTEEDHDVEELYLQGTLMLRAVWKDGQKVSEEYFRLSPGRNR